MTNQLNIQISSKSKNYPIFVGPNLLSKITELFQIISKYSKIAIITDKNVADFWLKVLLENLKKVKKTQDLVSIIISPGEAHKNLSSIQKIWQEMTDNNLDRKSLVICLGGGVVGDLGGFVASTYMRGIDFVQIPTTLVSQVDSSVGGKTGFDFLNHKNNIGSFAQPVGVLIDTLTLKTLPRREFLQGFGEVLKYGLAQNLEFWEFLKNLSIQNFTHNLGDLELQKIIVKCCETKAQVVQKDEMETLGLRKVLNFGHTFGHAIEMFSFEKNQKNLLHGEAVSLGIIVASKISELEGFISQKDFENIQKTIQKFELPTNYLCSKNSSEKTNIQGIKDVLYQKMLGDKKNASGQINWVLLSGIGNTKIDQKVDIQKVYQAMDEILNCD